MMRCLAFVALLGSALMQSVAFDVSWPRVVKVYRDGLDRAGIVGSSLVFVRDGTIQGKVFAGYQDQGTKRPVDEASITGPRSPRC